MFTVCPLTGVRVTVKLALVIPEFPSMSVTSLIEAVGKGSSSIISQEPDDTPSETFTGLVRLTVKNSVNVSLGVSSGSCAIIDDDPLPTASINDVTLVEGNSGITNANFTVTLTPVSGQTVNINYSTANGTAVAGSDFLPTNGTLIFNPGDLTQTISVPVIGDTLNESNETFFVNIS